MSTVSRGNLFEDRVFDALRKEVNAERLGLLPKQCTLHQKKGYYSRDRDSNIIVDISIEVCLPNASDWSMLWVCECKDYSGSLPVNDVEEFKAKLEAWDVEDASTYFAFDSQGQGGFSSRFL